MKAEVNAGIAPSKADQAYALLKERILDGTYVGGYRLVIDQLARETGISAIPWREAIRRLEAEGWLELVRNVGARVTTFDTAAYGQAVEVIARLEGFATALAVPRLDAESIAQARLLNQKMVEALENFDPVRFSALNREFHFVFYDRCGDDHLLKLIHSEWHRLDLIRRTVFSSVPLRARASVSEHEALLDLIESSDSFDDVETAARQHKLNLLQALREHESETHPS